MPPTATQHAPNAQGHKPAATATDGKTEIKDGKAPKVKKERVKKPGRIAYPGLDPKNPLETMPTDFDFKAHKGLKKKDFKGSPGFLGYRAAELRYRAGKLTTAADAMEAKGKREAQFGDEKTRKKANQVSKLKAQLAKLQQELSADPTINMEELGLA